MSQELESAKYYHEPTEAELAAASRCDVPLPCRLRRITKWSIGLFWLAFFGGASIVFVHAVRQGNLAAQSASGGGGPAMSMLSYVMAMVDSDWDRAVDQRIRENEPPAWRGGKLPSRQPRP